jgi:hypothetical protein
VAYEGRIPRALAPPRECIQGVAGRFTLSE